MKKEKKGIYTSKELTLIGVFVTLMIICSLISIPTGIPFTLQTFGVCVIGGLLGVKNGLTALLVYFLIGLAGLPVFSNVNGGIGVLLGPTGGYLIGFFFIVICIGISVWKYGNKTLPLTMAIITGHIACYTFGTAWFLLIYTGSDNTIGINAALSLCVMPYIIPDIIKGTLSIFFIKSIKKTNILNFLK